MTDHTDPTEPTDALAEVDRRGRRAAHALRTALAVAEPPGQLAAPEQPTPRADGGAIADPWAGGAVRDLTPPPGDPADDLLLLARRPTGPPHRRRPRRRALGLVAAGVLVAGGVALALRSDGEDPVTSQGPAAPSADLGGDETGIRPPEGGWRGFTVAGEGPDTAWQWTAVVPPNGTDLVFGLQDDLTRTTYVMEGIGEDPLRVATTDLAGRLPDGQVAVYGVAATGSDSVTVEWADAEPVTLDVVELRGDPSQPGPTHDLVVGWLPPDVGADATVVSRDGDGTEVARVPLGWAGETAEPDRTGSIYPDGAPAPTTGVGGEGEGVTWSAEVAEGGRNLVLAVSGYEDSAETVLTGPGDVPLQALATFLDGEGQGAVVVYGLVEAGAASVRLEYPDGMPLELGLSSIDGATHSAFSGVKLGSPDDGMPGAEVVAYDAAGTEIARTPLGWTRHDVVVQEGTLPAG